MKIGIYNKNNWAFEQLTPELAYLVGVYLGDGFVRDNYENHTCMRFGLRSIDKDFLDYTAHCIKVTFGDTVPVTLRFENYTYKGKTKVVTMFMLDYTKNSFCSWLLSLSKDKQHIPEIIPRIKCGNTKAFLEGLLDSEGWFSIRKELQQNGRHRFQLGIAACDNWILESKSIFQLCGIIIKKTQISKQKENKRTVYSYNLNPYSFALSGLQFHIKRKQDRVELYKKEMQIDPLRDFAPSGRHKFHRPMIKSDLNRNIKLT